uniref:Uncharacterized protein n=1 Tax=Cucumis melo TaxID=3656 RepID=A0A1S4E142_CUCME
MEGNDILEPLVEKAAAKHEAVSGELENILSDTELGYVVRIRRAAWIELKLLSKLAAPAVFVYMINNFMSMSTRIFSGHLGVAVGCGWQSFVACVNVCCYYLVGLPLGVLLGFYFKLGAKGIWLGMLSGTAIQTCILSWVTFRTDWNKEVDEAVKRLNKWNDTDDKTVKNIKIEALK